MRERERYGLVKVIQGVYRCEEERGYSVKR